jgi:hypothetical protein
MNTGLLSSVAGLVTGLAVAARLGLADAPLITVGPASQTIFVGDPVTFSVSATGAAPLGYQWLRNGAPITAAAASAYTIAVVTTDDQGAGFSVVVSNAYGAVTSVTAVLTVDLGVPGSPQTISVLAYTNVWRYNQSNNLDGVEWTASDYDDRGWQSGPGLLACEGNSAIAPLIKTPLLDPRVPPPGLEPGHAYYFRTTFNLPGDVIMSDATATFRCDDGAMIYLNGGALKPIRVPGGSATNQTLATEFPPFGGSDATEDETFTFSGSALRSGTNVIAVSVHQQNTNSTDIVWGMALDVTVAPRLRDTIAPTAAEMIPAAGATVPGLGEIEVHFSEDVKGVRAEDLLANGTPATDLIACTPSVYVFNFAPLPPGLVAVAWSPTQGITDLSANSNLFAGGSYSYTVDPKAIVGDVRITEFMAGNTETIRDEDGHYSDWLELYNAGSAAVNLGGWYLTDDPTDLKKWQFPRGVSLLSRSYLVVWASGNNRTNAAAPLHTNFKLNKAAGSFLALVYSDGITVVSAFSPYAQQYDNISYGRDRLDPLLAGYFTTPTPGAANATAGAGFASEVKFSVLSRTFQQPFTLALSTEDTAALIRCFLVTNGTTAAMTNVPNSSSPLYTGPLTISSSTQVRARAFPAQANCFPGPLRSESYVRISSAAAGFSSDVPLVLLYNFGAGGLTASYDQSAVMMVFGTEYGRASLTNRPDLAARIGINIRGNTAMGYAVETWDEYNDDCQVEVLGMPAQSDWVFYTPNVFDPGLIHNPLAYELSNQIGRYAVRTRFAEVFLNTSGGVVSFTAPAGGDYNGLWVVEEKIKRDHDRVNIAHLQPENANAPAVTGGYLLLNSGGRVDWNERVFYTPYGQQLTFQDPKGQEIQLPVRAAQEQYINDYFARFEEALFGPNYTDPAAGYAAWIDVDSWIDHHIANVLPLCADALRLSAFLYKDRSKKLCLGPIWDFDRSQGTTGGGDTRCFNPRAWRGRSWDSGTDFFGYDSYMCNVWMNRLFNDPDFWQGWIDRWQELRRDKYSTTNIFRLIDQFGNQVREAQTRMVKRSSETTPRSGSISANGYSYTFKGTYQGELDFQKKWYADRTEFIDTNFLSAPVFSRAPGPAPLDSVLTISANTRELSSTVYYTLDGTDPRLPGGAVNPAAFSSLTNATVKLAANARVFARNYNAAHQNLTGPSENPPLSSPWSGPTIGTFVVATPPLRVTELMFNPAPPPPGSTNNNDSFEFVELQNTSSAPLNVKGFQLDGGISFTFPNLVLEAGQFVVVVSDLAAFQSRYGAGSLVAGVYTNGLGNDGDHLVLTGPLGEPILDFSYNDTWYPAADGLGFSLVLRDAAAPLSTWGQADSWRPSTAINGSPGRSDPPPPDLAPILVTEALTHTDAPQADTVELFNPTTNWVNLGGWLLTDARHNPWKYRIPDGVLISPGGYLTLTTNEFGAGANGFALSSLGDEIYVFSADANANLTGYAHGYDFGPAPNGVSFGRYVNSQGVEQFVLQSRNTLGTNNAYPRVGPVVISEIMYNPPNLTGGPNPANDEFIELQNITAASVPLFDPLAPTNTWRLRHAVDFDFPTNVTLAAGARLLVVGFDPDANAAGRAEFAARYTVPLEAGIFGPWSGQLNNGGERLELQCPDVPDVTPTNVLIPYYLVEKVAYNNVPPWPTNADGGGASLQRIEPALFGNDPINWQAAPPTAGRLGPPGPPPDADRDGLPDAWELAHNTDPLVADADADPDHDGMSNLEEYLADTEPRDPNSKLVLGIERLGNAVRINWQGGVLATQYVQRLKDLNTSAWENLLTNPPPTPITGSYTDAPAMDAMGWYRLKATR